MNKKTLPLLALSATMLLTSTAGLIACKKVAPKEPYVIEGSLITVNKECVVLYEAENANIDAYVIASDNPTKIVEREDASGGQFLAAALGVTDEDTGELVLESYFYFTINLQFNAEISMCATYAQTESNKGKDIDMTKSYNYLIDGNRSIGITEYDSILNARDDITEWDEIYYDNFTLSKGTHSFHVIAPAESGENNPNIDCIAFDFTEIEESDDFGVTVPENDFHTPAQYAYIHDEDCTNVFDYARGAIELSIPAAINLDFSYLGKSSSYAVEYADNASFTNSVKVTGIKAAQYGVYNLKLGQDLYWRAAKNESGLKKAKVNVMTIATEGPRNLYIDGISNVRDIGGYRSSLAEDARINQGLYYRGAALVDVDRKTGKEKAKLLTDAGKAEMLRLGIKVEIDLRDTTQCTGPYVDGISYHPVSIPSGTESKRFEQFADEYLTIFNLIANADNNPVYLHCTAGADRTGIVSFILLTVCGASYEDIVRDYLFTNFSMQGVRKLESEFVKWWEKLDNFGKENKAENAKAWLLSKGVAESTVEHIREIFVDGYVAPKNFTDYITVNKTGTARYEAENANLDKWVKAGFHNTVVVNKGDKDKNGAEVAAAKTASNGKFVAAATGGLPECEAGLWLEFTVRLSFKAQVTLSAGYVQGGDKLSKTPDLSKNFTVSMGGKTLTINGNSVMSATSDGSKWAKYTYNAVTLEAGFYTFRLQVNYDENGNGNPNIDYFDFDVKAA